MAKSPAEQLSQILLDALNQWVKDNPKAFGVTVENKVQEPSGNTGITETDIISIIVGLLGLSLIEHPEAAGILVTLAAASAKSGSTAESFGIGSFMAEAAFLFANPYLREVTHAVEQQVQSQIFDPATAADMVAKGYIPASQGQSEASGGGFDEQHWLGLLDDAQVRPTWQIALSLWNRGYVQESDVNTALQKEGIPEYWWSALKQMRRELLSPADLALAVLRQNITSDDAVSYAALWGLSADDFQTLLLNTGEPPGTMMLLEAYRRGFIDEPTLDKGIRESRVRPEWIPTIQKLRYAPMSTAAAANAVTRGYLSYDDGAAIAQQNGLEPEHWTYVYRSNGRPPSHMQLAELYHRGIIDLATFQQGIRESDIKDKYIGDVVDLGVKLLPLFEGVNLFKNGDISAKTFSTQMLDQGYQKAVVDDIVKAIAGGTAGAPKRLTEAEIVSMYEDGSLSHDQTVTRLEGIGYKRVDAESLLTDANVRAAAARNRTLITAVRSQFDRFQVDTQTAQDDLITIGVDPKRAAKLLHDWTVVRPPGTKRLTEAQIMRLVRLKRISTTEAVTRLQADGYTETDATLLVSTEAPVA